MLPWCHFPSSSFAPQKKIDVSITRPRSDAAKKVYKDGAHLRSLSLSLAPLRASCRPACVSAAVTGTLLFAALAEGGAARPPTDYGRHIKASSESMVGPARARTPTSPSCFSLPLARDRGRESTTLPISARSAEYHYTHSRGVDGGEGSGTGLNSILYSLQEGRVLG